MKQRRKEEKKGEEGGGRWDCGHKRGIREQRRRRSD